MDPNIKQIQKSQVTLPKIHFKTAVLPNSSDSVPLSDQQQTLDLSKLDQWSTALPSAKRRRNHTLESIMFLYKANNKYARRKFSRNTDTEIGSVSIYIAQLEAELAKIKKINYMAIHQNIEYCAGIYRIAFEEVLKKLDEHHNAMNNMLSTKDMKASEIQEMKISEMKAKRLNDSKTRFPSITQQQIQPKNPQKSRYYTSRFSDKPPEAPMAHRNSFDLKKALEEKNEEIKQIRKMMQRISKEKLKVLHFCLSLGYDIREEGLSWILKEINKQMEVEATLDDDFQKDDKSEVEEQATMSASEKPVQKYHPTQADFPNFLTQQEIQFIISKYQNNFKLKVISQEKQIKQGEEKQIIQASFENIRKERNRKLSMIKQKELFEKLLNQKKQQLSAGHKYISPDTLKIMLNNERIKFTTNEIIYAETRRKLNKFCMQQIYCKRPKDEKQNKNGDQNDRVNKLMQDVRRMLSDSNKLQEKENRIKGQEEKELHEILFKLRNQIYEGERRNPISVIGCLVGWRAAKKLLEKELNIFMPASKFN